MAWLHRTRRVVLLSHPSRLFPGWLVVGASFAVLFVAYGAQYSFGVFYSAMLAKFGWSRGALSGAFSLYALVYCILGFLAGRLTDLWGPRVVIAIGGVFLGVAYAGMAFVTALWQPYVLYACVASIGMATAFVPTNSTVVRWFVRRRGLAVGITTSGQSAGMLVVAPLAQMLVSTVGWRVTYAVFGVTAFVALNAVAPLMRRDPESLGLTPDGDPRPLLATAEPERGMTIAQASRTGAFWALMATFTATWIPVFVAIVHSVPFARDLGASPLVAASLLTALGGGAVPGRIVMGAASDRIGRKRALAAMLVLQTIGFGAYAVAGSLTALFAAALLFGFSYGAITALFPSIVGDYFGRERAGALVGVFFAVAGSSGAIGPVAAGAMYDATGSYTLAFALSAAFNVVALLALAVARPPARAA